MQKLAEVPRVMLLSTTRKQPLTAHEIRLFRLNHMSAALDFTEQERVQIWYLVKDVLNPENWSQMQLASQQDAFFQLEDVLKRQLSRLSIGNGELYERIQYFILNSSYGDVLTLLQFLPLVPSLVYDQHARQRNPRFVMERFGADIERFTNAVPGAVNELLKTTSSPARFLENGEFQRKGFVITTPETLQKLPNRDALLADVRRMLTGADPFAVGFIDLDGFKAVNDTQGHAVGNKCLEAVAEVLGTVVKGKGKVYRYGGDEFAVLLPNAASNEAAATGERIRRTIEQRSLGGSVTVTSSIGIVDTDQFQFETAEEMVDAADAAGYASKRNGRNRLTLWHPSPSP